MFLMIIGHTTRYSIIGDRFQHSNNTIHKWFKRVLQAICSLGTEIISPTNQNGSHELLLRKYHFFKDYISAVDGTHAIQTCLDFLPLIEVEDNICVIMLDEEDRMERKSCSTINIHRVRT